MKEQETHRLHSAPVEALLDAVRQICERHGISALDAFQESCRAFAAEKTLNVAVLGRFKAGKSSFLNHLLGREVLPVGAVPVTSVVTEIQWGSSEQACIEFLDGRRELVSVDRIGDFISELNNPQNDKQVARVLMELPALARYRGIRFVDTPGLESVLEHNTDASLEWLPKVGLALVAVGVDPPLSQHDIELIRKLSRYTPNISLLLTKVDILNPAERAQVVEFVKHQLARYWNGSVPVFPFSIRPGFEDLRLQLESRLLSEAHAGAGEQHAAILAYKLDSLLSECAGYLGVALKAAEVADSEREHLRRKLLGEQESLDDTRLALKLIVRHTAGGARKTFENLLQPEEAGVRDRLQTALRREFPQWTSSLSVATERFDDWLRARLEAEMAALSKRRRDEFIAPVRRVSRQLSQALQDFRNRLSERVLETLGVSLRTTELELPAEDPRAPDVRIGRIFDRNWELLSWAIPMPLIRGMLLNHFHRKVDDLVYINLSRLATQWNEIVGAALQAFEKEALRRLDSLIGTIEKLTASAGRQAPQIRADLATIEELRRTVKRA